MSKKEDFDYQYKIILIGDSGVGKTSFIVRYTKGIFPQKPGPTIGVEFATKTILLNEGQGLVKTQIWDTQTYIKKAGSIKYKSITTAHYRKAAGVLLFYNLTDEKSFESVQDWLEAVKEHVGGNVVVMLIGNKLDAVQEDESQRKIPKQDILQFAEKNNLIYRETSAKSGLNVKESFEELVQTIYNRSNNQNIGKEEDNIKIKPGGNKEEENNNDTCCKI